MKKTPFIFGVLLLLSSCGYEALQPSFKSENTFEGGDIQTPPNFTQFKEIPIPEKAVMDLKKTLLFGDEPLVGRLAFSAPYSQTGMFDFYVQEMPKFGWRKVTMVRSTSSVLTYSKGERIATIQLLSTAVSGTDVVFDISMAKYSKGY